jgi:putative SOS response-associated peptidase YedK
VFDNPYSIRFTKERREWRRDINAAGYKRKSAKCRRCLIPADAFYEWKRIGKSKQPYCFEVNDDELFAFAGIWDRWKNASGN